MIRLSIPALVALLLAAVAAPVAADQVYHTERLVLVAADKDVAGSGMVVNIHPNGPNRYAIEQYQLRHAEPNSRYQIELHLYLDPGATDCSGAPFSLPTAEIVTNEAGNGTAQLVLTPADVGGLPVSFPINWTASQGGPIGQGGTETHRTACTIVTLD